MANGEQHAKNTKNTKTQKNVLKNGEACERNRTFFENFLADDCAQVSEKRKKSFAKC